MTDTNEIPAGVMERAAELAWLSDAHERQVEIAMALKAERKAARRETLEEMADLLRNNAGMLPGEAVRALIEKDGDR